MEPAPPHANSLPARVHTPSERWFNATTARSNNCASPEYLSAANSRPASRKEDQGSIIVILATDAPLVASQLKRLARRVPLGLGRLGSYSGDGSGDIFIAFSTANPGAWGGGKVKHIDMLPNEEMNPLFIATVQCVEEAVVNAMVAAKDMKGINNFPSSAESVG